MIRIIIGLTHISKIFVGIVTFSLVFTAFNAVYLFGDGFNTVILYFYQYLSLFLIVAIVSIAPSLKTELIISIASIIFWISFYSIIIEFILVNYLGIPREYMPAVRYTPSYFNEEGLLRPFGLTGQTSVNGGILLISFLVLVEFNIVNKKKYLALIVGVIATISGQAIVSTAIILSLLWLRNLQRIWMKILYGGMLFLAIFAILNLNIAQKISWDYLVTVLIDKSHLIKNLELLNSWQLFFGSLGTSPRPEGTPGSEVFFVTAIQLYGIVFTTMYFLFVWYLVRDSRISIILFLACLLSFAHYPSLFYIEAQVPLALLYFGVFQKLNSSIDNKAER